jgi:hypothetical protein
MRNHFSGLASRMSFYILISHGRRPTGDIRSHTGARQQFANLKLVADHFGQKINRVHFDYCRHVAGLASLPKLSVLLEQARATDGLVVVDDFRRVFTKIPSVSRASFWDEIEQFASNFLDIRTRERLSEKSNLGVVQLLTSQSPCRFVISKKSATLNEADRRAQTRAAGLASVKARGASADTSAIAVRELFETLSFNGQRVKLGDLAAHANTLGLRTSRGRQWTSSSVHRALKRVPEKARRSEND